MATALTIPTGTVRMIGLISAKDGMTHEEFTERWLKHGELIRSMDYVQKNILKYEQYHLDTSLPAEYRDSLVGCSGIAVMEADSLDQILGIFTSEEFLAKGLPSQETFLNREKSTMFPALALTVHDNSGSGEHEVTDRRKDLHTVVGGYARSKSRL